MPTRMDPKPPARGYVVPDAVISEVIDGEAVLLNLQTGQYYALNRIATRMIDRLRGRDDPDQICQEIASEYSEDLATVKQDFHALAKALAERGLLRFE